MNANRELRLGVRLKPRVADRLRELAAIDRCDPRDLAVSMIEGGIADALAGRPFKPTYQEWAQLFADIESTVAAA
jgi:hypothetical protein